ncbi:uncharacterized protein LOC106768713 [Vigna radiata var. radiata]|uniref:Uncharacterized protein LOC106768713 n=1 Tax=Vigna radiata var. radiata TaxID=3916 RepID=A0A1S3UU25_VIGRR|nr:uncharacterized protein LOC106768713 [Vigna radiata var. radiata]
MAAAIQATKQQKLPLQQNQQDPNKFYYHFLYKAALFLIFFVILPLFPSQAPHFINQSLLTRNWELLHLLFVGVAISYGLFSRRNHEVEKENNHSKFDTAQTLVSKFLQVSSFFEDEPENPPESDETKLQTWSNQHRRNEPVVVVAPPLKKLSSFDDQSGDKPLLLPIRSLKSRLSDDDKDVDVQSLNMSMSSRRFSSTLNRKGEVVEADGAAAAVDVQCLNRSKTFNRFSSNSSKSAEVVVGDVDDQSLNRSSSSKRFSSNSNRKAEVEADDVDVGVQSLNRSASSKRFSSNSNRNAEVEGPRAEDKKKESVVLPSPIPWRSRSGRMEPKQEEVDNAFSHQSSKEESEFSKVESRPAKPQTSRSFRASSLSSLSTESLAKNSEDLVRKKGFYKSCPPPPPPPPPMMYQKSVSMKPRYGGSFIGPSLDKELKRSFTSEKKKPAGKKLDEEKESMQRTSFRSDKLMGHASVPLVSQAVEKESYLDKVLVESDDDDEEDTETEDEDVGGGIMVENEGKAKGGAVIVGESSKDSGFNGTSGDEGPDVDKKADEFIAKFREQIRLQRIESIKRSTRNARNSSR